MVEAIILLNVRPGYESEILEILKNKKYVKKAVIVYGEYDLVVEVEIGNIMELRHVVLEEIRKIEGVEKTMTLIVAT